MKNYIFYFVNVSNNITKLLNGYLFTDPVTNTGPSYPLTADGGLGVNFTAYSSAFSLTAWDGFFYPYGTAPLNNNINNILPDFKGDYTIYFSATALDAPLQIIYDFGDGQKTIETQTSITNTFYSDINTYLFGLNNISIKYQNISHTYFAPVSPLTLYPTITVINSDLTFVVYNLQFTQYPNSIYDLNDIHILDSIQEITSNVNSLNIIELTDSTQTTKLVVDGVNKINLYPSPYILSTYSNLSS